MRMLIAWLVIGSLQASYALAQEPRTLRYDLRLDLPLTLSAAALWGGSFLLRNRLTPEHCRWCAENQFDERARDAMRWSHPQRAGTLSDVAAVAIMPAISFAGLALLAERAHASKFIFQDALFVFEALSISALATQVVKFSVARERPYAHHDAIEGQPTDSFVRTSFYSAHASRVFSLAAAAGMVASMRGYRFAPLIWTLGFALATFVAYARVAGDYHYLSDVLVGAGVGSLVGAGLPWLLHRPVARVGRVSVSANSLWWIFEH